MSERQFLRMDNWVMIRSLATQSAYVPVGGAPNVDINLFTVSRIW
jgi:hypothetical protein